MKVEDVDKINSFSSKLVSLYHQYKYFLGQNHFRGEQLLVCQTLSHELSKILDKGVFNGQDLVSLLEILIASDVLRGDEKNLTKDDRYFQLCNDQLKDLLYMSFKEVIQ